MKKLISMLTLSVLCGFVLTFAVGCGDSKPTTKPPEKKDEPKKDEKKP